MAVRRLLYAAALASGAVLGLLGSQPLWLPGVIALLVFPPAAAIAGRRSRQDPGRRSAQLGAAALVALAGGLLATLAIRLAVDAPGWLSPTAADCGGPSTATQQLVLWSAALIFAGAAVPVAATLLHVGRRLAPGGAAPGGTSPLGFYPVAVAASGIALIAAGYATHC